MTGQQKDLGLPPLLQGGSIEKKTHFEKKWFHLDIETCKEQLLKKVCGIIENKLGFIFYN